MVMDVRFTIWKRRRLTCFSVWNIDRTDVLHIWNGGVNDSGAAAGVQLRQDAFLHKWVNLVRQLSRNAVTGRRLLIDPFDELDQFWVRWETNASTGALGQGGMYLQLYDALWKLNPHMLLLVQVRSLSGEVSIEDAYGWVVLHDSQLAVDYL